MSERTTTATERLLRHGVAGGWGNGRALIHRGGNYYAWSDHGDNVYDEMFSVGDALLDLALWRCAGKALGKTHIHGDEIRMCRECRQEGGANSVGGCDHCGARGHHNFPVWSLYASYGLLDHLAAHPGDVEGYMASLLDDDPLPHQEPCNCRDCSLTDAKGTE